MKADNLFEELAIYNTDGKQIGKIDRETAHRSKDYMHGAVHVFVFNRQQEILLQKRTKTKILNPCKYDISAGGHIQYGESELEAAKRELEEELGIKDANIKYLYRYIWEYALEREYVFTYFTIWEGEINFLKSEIDEVRFFKIDEITDDEIFTKNLIYEIELFKKSQRKII